MVIDERARHQLFQKLEEKLGPDEAAILMEHLPPVGWGEVATKRDLEVHQAATKRDLEAHQLATKRDLEAHQVATKRDLDAHQVATKRDLEAHQLGTKRDLEMLRLELTAQVDRALRRQTWAFMTSQAVIFFGISGLVLSR
jgi:hypothetical protein